VYLGDWHHAADPVIIEKLGITHILNISDTCENYLQTSHPYLTYLQKVILDETISPISPVFRDVFEFIETAVVPQNY